MTVECNSAENSSYPLLLSLTELQGHVGGTLKQDFSVCSGGPRHSHVAHLPVLVARQEHGTLLLPRGGRARKGRRVGTAALASVTTGIFRYHAGVGRGRGALEGGGEGSKRILRDRASACAAEEGRPDMSKGSR